LQITIQNTYCAFLYCCIGNNTKCETLKCFFYPYKFIQSNFKMQKPGLIVPAFPIKIKYCFYPPKRSILSPSSGHSLAALPSSPDIPSSIGFSSTAFKVNWMEWRLDFNCFRACLNLYKKKCRCFFYPIKIGVCIN